MHISINSTLVLDFEGSIINKFFIVMNSIYIIASEKSIHTTDFTGQWAVPGSPVLVDGTTSILSIILAVINFVMTFGVDLGLCCSWRCLCGSWRTCDARVCVTDDSLAAASSLSF